MIKIDFQPPAGDKAWADWVAACEKAQAAFNAATEDPSVHNPKASSKIYGASNIKERFYLAADSAFHGKCAYCEETVYRAQRVDIDHYRPKGAIKDAQGNKVKRVVNGVEEDHPGYYWLAYNWKNLLPTCQLCNQANKRRAGGGRTVVGKLDYFPLADESRRATAPGAEVNESPLLINPLWEDPAPYLVLDAKGVFAADDGPDGRGQACIDTFGLNFKGLSDERAKVYDDVFNLMLALATMIFNEPNGQKTRETRARIRRIEDGYEAFSAAARLAIRDARELIKTML